MFHYMLHGTPTQAAHSLAGTRSANEGARRPRQPLRALRLDLCVPFSEALKRFRFNGFHTDFFLSAVFVRRDCL